MTTNTIHYLAQEEPKEFCKKVASKRDKALTRRACGSLCC